MSKKLKRKVTQLKVVMEFFKQNPNRDILHPEVVDWAEKQYFKKTEQKLRDPDRAIRRLHQDGILVKIADGKYRYDPELVKNRKLENFSQLLKDQILKRDGYRCVMCGCGVKEGAVLHVDHVKPKDLGGRATLENGQTLCSKHNFLKKNFKQTETGKKLFIRLYELAKAEKNEQLKTFSEDILDIFAKHDMNGHIEWKK